MTTSDPTTSPQDVRVEHRDGVGIGEPAPRLSWRLPAGTTRQLAYEIRLDDGTTERVEGDANVLVPWPGRPLASGERRDVQVRVGTDRGTSAWSEPVAVEAGLLDASDWRVAGSRRPRPQVRRAPGRRTCCAARSTSTARSPGPGSTRPRTGSTSSLNGAPGRRRRARPGLHRVRRADPGADLRRDRPARAGHATCSARCSPTGGTAARSGSCAPPTSGASGPRSSPSCTSSTTTAAPPSSAPDAGWRWSDSHILAADLIEGQCEDRRLLDGW